MKEIELTKGLKSKVDDEDYERVSKFKWHAGKSGHNFYAKRAIRENGKLVSYQKLHHFVFGKKTTLDHVNGDSLDNRKSNLRECTNNQNRFNSIKKSHSKLRYKGIETFTMCAKKNPKTYYRASVVSYGIRHRSSKYRCQFCAALERDRIAIIHHGEFAKLNFN